jgi:anti-anti-sigma regulatory factor
MSTPRTLPAELSIYTVGELKAQCLAWLGEPAAEDAASDGRWPLAAGAVDQIDAAGVQLLVSLAHTLDRQQLSLHLSGASEALTDACKALGLGDWLTACSHDGATA